MLLFGDPDTLRFKETVVSGWTGVVWAASDATAARTGKHAGHNRRPSLMSANTLLRLGG
jgi:hypothetical protein